MAERKPSLHIACIGLYRLYKPCRPMSEKPAARAMVLPSKSCCACRLFIGEPHLWLVGGCCCWWWLVVVGGGCWLAGGGWLAGRAGA